MEPGTKKIVIAVIIAAVIVVAGIAGAYYFIKLPTEEAEALKVAWIGTTYEGATWCRANLAGLRQAATAWTAKHPERPIVLGETYTMAYADFSRVAERYIEEGYTMIVAGDIALEVIVSEFAPSYPDVYFNIASVAKEETLTDNIDTIGWDVWRGYYLAGIIAGAMTETNILGFVLPIEWTETARAYNALMAGAKRYNPDVEGIYAFTGNWMDPTPNAAAASALVMQGADVIAGMGDGGADGALKGAEAEGVYGIGYAVDRYEIAPHNVLTSVVWNTTPYYMAWLNAYDEGTLGHNFWYYTLKERIAYLAPYHEFEDVIPADAKALVNQVIEDAVAGTFEVPDITEFP